MFLGGDLPDGYDALLLLLAPAPEPFENVLSYPQKPGPDVDLVLVLLSRLRQLMMRSFWPIVAEEGPLMIGDVLLPGSDGLDWYLWALVRTVDKGQRTGVTLLRSEGASDREELRRERQASHREEPRRLTLASCSRPRSVISATAHS